MGFPKDFNLIKYNCLVPGGIQGGVDDLRGFASMEKGDVSIWIYGQKKIITIESW